jgi:hypothetical protein
VATHGVSVYVTEVRSPQVAVVCLEYGAHRGAQLLLKAGVPTVVFLTGSLLGEAAARLLLQAIAPALDRIEAGDAPANVGATLLASLLPLSAVERGTGTAPTSENCGCLRSMYRGGVGGGDSGDHRWAPATAAAQSAWVQRAPQQLTARGHNLDASDDPLLLRPLPLLACDISGLRRAQEQLHRCGEVAIYTDSNAPMITSG